MKSVIALIASFFISTTYAFAAENPKVLMETSMGNVTIELHPDKAPISVENFLGYVNSGSYDGTIFHRLRKQFRYQGGGVTAVCLKIGTLSAIHNEADNGLGNDRGTIAMARTQDPNSATAQFFINHKNNDFLNIFHKIVIAFPLV